MDDPSRRSADGDDSRRRRSRSRSRSSSPRRRGDDKEERHRKRKRKDDDDGSDDDSESDRCDRKRKHHKIKKKKKSKKHRSKRGRHDDDSYSSDSDSDSSSRTSSSSYSSSSNSSDEDRKKKKKKRKRKHDNKHSKKKKKRKRDKNSKGKDKGDEDEGPVFGKYGILKASDFHSKQREFEVWMAEVKGMPEYRGPKWETQQYFDSFREDYNTATMPHVKYYDYEKWEMEEYKKLKAKQLEKAGISSKKADEVQHQIEQQKSARRKQIADHNLVMSMMSKEKIQEMKRQQQLKAELEVAFKTGDQEKIKKLKAKLEPEER